jgi:cysteine-rich repeat protein
MTSSQESFRSSRYFVFIFGSSCLSGVFDFHFLQVSLSVSTSPQNFYLVKDAFISNLAFVLGINPRRISIVDVVAGRRRRARSLFQSSSGGSTSISMEIVPDPVISFDPSSITGLDTVGVINITAVRTVNVVGNCSAVYSVYSDSSTTAIAGYDFVSSTGNIVFLSGQTRATIQVSIFSSASYRPVVATFWVSFTSVANASLGAASVLISLQGVFPPPPAAPTAIVQAATASSITVQWVAPQWSSAPSIDFTIPIAWDLSCNWSNSEFSNSSIVPDQIITAATAASAVSSYSGSSDASGAKTIDGLSTYTAVQCRVRMQTSQGWADWSPFSSVMRSLAVCGDGIRQGSEECDDGNLTSGDGCSPTCTVEYGWSCSRSGLLQPDQCNQGCGNGTFEGSEQCDDGNYVAGDGCSSTCIIERGWTCTLGSGQSVCNTTCGDGIWIRARERCDDGNNINGDGCAANCTVEVGAICLLSDSGGSRCQICGNGRLEGFELCDDARISGACNATCTGIVAGWSCTQSSSAGSTCVAGPAAPDRPVSTDIQITSTTWEWITPNDFGLPIVHFNWQIATLTPGNLTLDWSSTTVLKGNSTALSTATQTLEMLNLSSATVRVIRVRACSQIVCGPFSFASAPARTLDEPAKSLQAVGSALQSGNLQGLGLNISNLTVTQPPDPPATPVADTTGLVNVSDLLVLMGLNGSQSNPSFVPPQPAVDYTAPVPDGYPSNIPTSAYSGDLLKYGSLPALVPSNGCAGLVSGLRLGPSTTSAMCAIVNRSRAAEGFFRPSTCSDSVVAKIYSSRGNSPSAQSAAAASGRTADCSATVYDVSAGSILAPRYRFLFSLISFFSCRLAVSLEAICGTEPLRFMATVRTLALPGKQNALEDR